MPCPYFFPTERCAEPLWPHPERLPLGAGFHGRCTAPGDAFTPDGERLHDCNLGYARCNRLPAARSADAVRFSARDREAGTVDVQFVCEAAHAPVAHGLMTFNVAAGTWSQPHPDPCIRRMAECCVASLRKEQ